MTPMIPRILHGETGALTSLRTGIVRMKLAGRVKDFAGAAPTDSRRSKSDLRAVLGLDIGGSKIAIVEGTVDAQILQRCEMATQPFRRFDRALPELSALINEVIKEARNAGRETKASDGTDCCGNRRRTD